MDVAILEDTRDIADAIRLIEEYYDLSDLIYVEDDRDLSEHILDNCMVIEFFKDDAILGYTLIEWTDYEKRHCCAHFCAFETVNMLKAFSLLRQSLQGIAKAIKAEVPKFKDKALKIIKSLGFEVKDLDDKMVEVFIVV